MKARIETEKKPMRHANTRARAVDGNETVVCLEHMYASVSSTSAVSQVYCITLPNPSGDRESFSGLHTSQTNAYVAMQP